LQMAPVGFGRKKLWNFERDIQTNIRGKPQMAKKETGEPRLTGETGQKGRSLSCPGLGPADKTKKQQKNTEKRTRKARTNAGD